MNASIVLLLLFVAFFGYLAPGAAEDAPYWLVARSCTTSDRSHPLPIFEKSAFLGSISTLDMAPELCLTPKHVVSISSRKPEPGQFRVRTYSTPVCSGPSFSKYTPARKEPFYVENPIRHPAPLGVCVGASNAEDVLSRDSFWFQLVLSNDRPIFEEYEFTGD
jgi:hypothetical protein